MTVHICSQFITIKGFGLNRLKPFYYLENLVGLGGLEPPTSPLSERWPVAYRLYGKVILLVMEY